MTRVSTVASSGRCERFINCFTLSSVLQSCGTDFACREETLKSDEGSIRAGLVSGVADVTPDIARGDFSGHPGVTSRAPGVTTMSPDLCDQPLKDVHTPKSTGADAPGFLNAGTRDALPAPEAALHAIAKRALLAPKRLIE